MNDPNLSLKVKEALNSDPGSSKRTNALAVLRSITKTANPLTVGQAPAFQGSLSVKNAPAAPMGGSQLQGGGAAVSPSMGQVSGSQAPQQGAAAGTAIQGGVQPDLQGMPVAAPPVTFMMPSAPKKRASTLPADVASQNGVPTEEFSSWYDKQPQEIKDKYKTIYEATQAGIGKETFAWEMMSDTNKLKTLPGLENTPEDELPIGASLTRQIADIEKTLRTEYDLDQKVSNLQKLSDRGLTIEDNLNTYINARDKYLANVNSMIDTAKSSMVDLDIGNPFVADRMNKYMNYLYILKGRQQKRYANFLDSAITQHNSELSRAQIDYNQTLDLFKRDLTTKKDITTEDYKRLSTMLENMYTNFDEREKKDLELQKLKEEVIKAHGTNSGDIIVDLTPTDKNDIAGFERTLGKSLSTQIWNVIFTNLSSQERRNFVQTLKESFTTNPGLGEQDILDLLSKFIADQEAGNVANPFAVKP